MLSAKEGSGEIVDLLLHYRAQPDIMDEVLELYVEGVPINKWTHF